MLGIKQEVLAIDLGISRQAVSLMEQKETLDAPVLEKVAAILKMPVEAIKNLDDEQAVNIISNTFNEGAFVNTGHTPNININPAEKWLEAIEENKRLYERMIEDRDSMITMLKDFIAGMKK